MQSRQNLGQNTIFNDQNDQQTWPSQMTIQNDQYKMTRKNDQNALGLNPTIRKALGQLQTIRKALGQIQTIRKALGQIQTIRKALDWIPNY